ncbi:ABC transporter substrate-binding protein [Selenomonas sp. oral taxon 126]|uniref:ABC transporter substrate-binding protein n=1 Tax=Selenomonas sp. oral taxon 126 TaxID=712528 RepID=UPI000A74B6E5|nr:ABC transporter substrate-binding protein [Selenomonas sp. oral taxon 126]
MIQPMTRRLLALLLVLCTALALAGCGEKQTVSHEERVVTDTTGRAVKLPAEVKSLAIVPIPWASVVYAVDGTGARVAGMHPSAKAAYANSMLKTLSPEMENASTDFVGQDFAIHMEELGKLNPSAIIVWNYQEDEIAQLEKLNVPTIALKYGTMEDLQNGIRVIGQVLGKEERAASLVQFQQDTMAYFDGKKAALADTPKPKVLYLRDGDLKVAGGAAVNTMMIETAGGVNVAKDVQGQWTPVTMEQVAAWDPDVIILSNFAPIQPADLYEDKLAGQNWKNIAAVREGRVYKAPLGLYRWDAPSVETPLMIKWLAQKLHPAVFADYVLKDDLRAFYEKFFSYQLTDADLKEILHE